MTTTSRRAPLSNIANATNSPHRILNNSGSKRPRAFTGIGQQENEPPQKRQALEKSLLDNTLTTPRRLHQTPTEGRVFEKSKGEAGSNAFQRRLVAARDRNTLSKASKHIEENVSQNTKDADAIRQWQKHYRKVFPTFSFYFDSVPDDLRARYVRHIIHLGAREEKFFSKNVTHIITSRQIQLESNSSRSFESQSAAHDLAVDENNQTINPSLLEKNSVARPYQSGSTVRRDVSSTMDILTRGRQMGMKIWATEKLQRVLTSIIEDAGTQTQHARGMPGGTRTQEDLSQVLRNEKIGNASEREQVSMPREVTSFRGPFLYIHDMDEKVRPIMVREYPKVARRQDGEWPQFRSATVGKCPFVEDPAMRREIEQEKARQKASLSQQKESIARTRSTVALEGTKMEPPRRMSPRKALQNLRNPAVLAPATTAAIHQADCKLERQSSFPPMPEQPAMDFIKPAHMHLIREPAASGIQRSNMTSAIQSQMISSTAATGVKTGTSKEVHDMKRKVLERGHTGSLSVGSMPSSHRMTDLTGALKNPRAPAPQRAAKSKAQEKLGGITEEACSFADDLAAEKAAHATGKKQKATRKDPKPGYCENCHDKYDDFEEHIVTRKHRKFALTQSNWDELDALLRKLQAP